MELAAIVITVLIPLLACCVYYCHHLQLQLVDCDLSLETCRNAAEVTDTTARERKKYLVDHGSSVWCHGASNTDRRCVFSNLCYHPGFNDFVFLHASGSVYAGVPEDRHRPALVDLSSVPDHNTQYFHFVDLPGSYAGSLGNLTYLEGRFLLFNRFNPGNLMHVLHDDLLPVYHTLLQLGFIHSHPGSLHATLMMSDGQEEGEYFHFYQHLSNGPPILTKQLQQDVSDFICFEEVHVGLSQSTTWYQYGFQSPQGPLENRTVTAREIKLFTSFVKSKSGITDCALTLHRDDTNVFVILSRRTNRLILNEVEVSMALAQHFNATVIVASLETHSLSDLIQLISCSNGLVAIHGSLLSLSVFLPVDSILIEIFPYAVNPSNYTPYKTLAHLRGMRITYRSWRNMDVQRTVAHPDAQPEFGGISHLESAVQDRILSSPEVPLHLCCNDPEWLFRIYQDTEVDIKSFLRVVEGAIGEWEKVVASAVTEEVTLIPGAVRNISCYSVPIDLPDEGGDDDEIGILLSWKPPWNLPSIQDHFPSEGTVNVKYEVLIQEQGAGDLYAGAFALPMTRHTFREGFKRGRLYYAWIRCSALSKTGPYTAITSCPFKEH